jgi:hypothetical protein
MKFGRRCKLSVEVAPDAKGMPQANVTIPQDFTIEFSITRKFLSSSQTATFRIFNLGEKTRNLLQKDAYATTERRAIQFHAGYDDFPLPLCFNGQVMTAYSVKRSGSTEFVTVIEAFDGGVAMANGFVSQTIASGTTVRDVLLTLAKSLPVTAGEPIIGQFDGVNSRGEVLFGNTWGIIVEKSGKLATIDNGQVKILQPNEALRGQIPVITAASGLLGSPERSSTNLEFEILFEPQLTIGQIVDLEGSTNRLYNGTYKVTGFTHEGVISPVESGKCSTKVGLFFGAGELKLVKGNIVQ